MPEALHYSKGKSGVDQIPPEVIMEWGDVYTYGEKKYARDNWRGGTNWSQMYGSALRHMFKFWMGEDYDDCDGSEGCAGAEADFCAIHSRQHHVAQAIWNLGAIRYWQIHGKGIDDRDPVVRRKQCTATTGKDREGAVCQVLEGHSGPHRAAASIAKWYEPLPENWEKEVQYGP